MSATDTTLSPTLQTEPSAGPDSRPTGRRSIRVLVLDDHPAVRWGLVQLLEDQPDLDVAAVATTAEAAVAQAEHEAVEVAIVDYSLGGRNGLWVTRKLKALPRPPRVVVFSAFANDHLAASCAVAGADGLLSKASLGEDLCYAVRAIARGRKLLPRVPSDMTGLLRNRLDGDRERMVFAMLLAEIDDAQIARTLGLGEDELFALRTRMLTRLEPLPGEPPASGIGRTPLHYHRPTSR